MKKLILSLILGAALSSAALADTVTEVRCRNTSGLPSGFSLSITKDTETDVLSASFSNRDNLGPYINLGSIPVIRKYVSPEIMGAPITYVGKDFDLEIIWDGGAEAGGAFHSYVHAVLEGRTFDEPMLCTLTD